MPKTVTYTALREINTALDTIQVLDHNFAASKHLRSASNVTDYSKDIEVTVRFRVESVALTQELFRLQGAMNVFVNSSAQIRVYRQPDAAGDNLTEFTLAADTEYFMRVRYFTSGDYEVEIVGVIAGGSFTTAPTGTNVLAVGNYSASNPLLGFVYDISYHEDNVLQNAWPGTDGSGTDFEASVGGVDLIEFGAAGSPGWESYTPAHVSGTEYTLTIKPKRLDRSRVLDRTVVEGYFGASYSTLRQNAEEFRVELSPVTGEEANTVREFLASTMAGEAFRMNLQDGNGNRTMKMKGKGFREKRSVRRGDGGLADYFTFGFDCRALG